MKIESKVVFREKAQQLYLRNQQKLVVLKLAQPRLFPYFWVILAALALLVLAAWTARIPVSRQGLGLVLDPGDASGLMVVSLLPAEDLASLRVDQPLILGGQKAGRKPLLEAELSEVRPTVMSPAEIRASFGLDAALGSQVLEPRAVAVARIAAAQVSEAQLAPFTGSALPVEVEVGSRRVLSLIPGLRLMVEN